MKCDYTSPYDNCSETDTWCELCGAYICERHCEVINDIPQCVDSDGVQLHIDEDLKRFVTETTESEPDRPNPASVLTSSYQYSQDDP